MACQVQQSLDQGGLEGGAVYIATDHRFPHQRLFRLSKSLAGQSSSVQAGRLLSNIHVFEAKDLDAQHQCLCYALPHFLDTHPTIRLIVVDSFSCNFRCEDLSVSSKSSLVYDMACSLKKLAAERGLVVLCTNQVSDLVTSTSASFGPSQRFTISLARGGYDFMDPDFYPGKKKPSLGLVWSNMVTTRLCIQKQSSHGPSRREITLLFSPFSKSLTSVPCVLSDLGIQTGSF